VDDVVGRIEESAGRVEFDQDSLIMIRGGGIDGATDVLGGDRMNRVVNDDLEDVGGGGCGKE